MKTYLVPGLDDAQRRLLIEAGVPFYPWAAQDIMVDEKHIATMLKTLGATATEQATEYENMFKVALRYQAPATAQPARIEEDPDSPRARSRAQYIKVCSARMQAVVNAAAATALSTQQAVPAALNKFAQASRTAAFAAKPPTEEHMRAQLAEEVQRLREIPQVKDVRVIPGTLLVYTHALHVTSRDTKRKHEIGHFLIRIRLDGRDGGVRWFNATRRVNGVRPAMNAPNVFADGSPCADEMIPTFIELIAQLQLSVVAELAIQFIETTNDDELSKTVDRWPFAAATNGRRTA